MSLLPPNATAAERALEEAMLSGIDMSAVATVWNPATCPAEILPYLAWSIAISHWDTTWSEAEKRAAVAKAMPFHKIKGTRAAVEQVLARFSDKLTVTEWWESSPRRDPHTFEVRANGLEVQASFLTEEMAQAIVEDVAAAKPLRAHFDFVQNLDLAASNYFAGGALTGGLMRADYDAALDASRDWDAVLQTEIGEPIYDGDSTELLETA